MSALGWLDRGDIAAGSVERTRSSRSGDSRGYGGISVRKAGAACKVEKTLEKMISGRV
jgi:hypothetical protein